MHPYLDTDGPVAVAHRGADPTRENTVEAFSAAVAAGCGHLETDARSTSDGVAVAFHDATLERLTGERRLVRSLRWRDLATVRVGGGCVVPRLDDVLAAFPGVRFPIDVKDSLAVAATARAVQGADAVDRVCIGSFSERRLRATVALLGPRVCFSLGPRGVASVLRTVHLGQPLRRVAPCAQLPIRLGPVAVCTPSVVSACRRAGMPVYAWTVNDPSDMRALLEMGVDGVVTDDLPTLMAMLPRSRDEG